ncbi:IS110 family transposase [Paenibacillus uliginis]|uniref:IS110 family transposase n=1 Tax=Paenibacillus uliginis TaxID=683737 RepID=UPI001FCCFC88|nr:IS110 family transposase [Paenibacillus uliginis]
MSSKPQETIQNLYHLLRNISGIGPLTAAMLIAEIGDIKRFPSVKQLAAFAGLDSAVHESGTFKSKKNRISKRGSQYLRTALYQATVAAISKQIHGPRNSTLFQFYQQKRNEGKPAKSQLLQLLTSFYALFLECGTLVELFKLVKPLNW